MARAVLEIAGDTTSLEASFARAKSKYRETAESIDADARRSGQAREAVEANVAQSAARGGQSRQRSAAQVAKAEEAEAKKAARAVASAEAQKLAAANTSATAQIRAISQVKRAAEQSADTRKRIETQASEIAAREAQARGLSAQQEATVRQRAMERLTSVYAREESRRTAEARRQERERASAARERGVRAGRILGAAGAVGSGVVNGAMAVHGVMQGQRAQRATTEHTLNAALYQAGIGGDEAAQARARVIATARDLNLDPAQVAEGISAAQTQFSSLSGRTAAERRGRMDETLENVRFAHATYQDPGEVLRVAGMLSQQGVHGADQRAALQSMTGIAQAGSIELSDVTASALGPLMQNISVATARLGANATGEQRSAAVREATSRTLAVGEVGAAAGLSSRDSMNAYAKLQRGFADTRVTGNLYNALHSRHHDDVNADLFETARDERGQTVHRLRAGVDPLQAMSRVMGAYGGDSTAVANLLHGGGHGAPQIMDAQTRRLVGALQSQTAGGESMATHVDNLMRQGAEFGAADEARGRTLRSGEDASALQRNANDATYGSADLPGATRDLTTETRNLSNAFTAWTASNPLAAAAAPVLGGAVARGAGALLGVGAGPGGLIAAGGLGSVAGLAGSVRGRDLEGNHLSVFRRVAGLLGGGAGEGGREIGDYISHNVLELNAPTAPGTPDRGTGQPPTIELGPNTIRQLAPSIHDAATAAGRGATARQAAPPTGR